MSDIAAMVKEFLGREAKEGMNMEEWLSGQLPQVLKIEMEVHRERCRNTLEDLAKETGNPDIAKLSTEDGSLEREYNRLQATYKKRRFKPLLDKVIDYNRCYQEVLDDLTLLTADIMPMLQDFKQGRTPTAYHGKLLKLLGSPAEENTAMGSNIHYPNYYPDSHFVPNELKVPENKVGELEDFFAQLHQVVKVELDEARHREQHPHFKHTDRLNLKRDPKNQKGRDPFD